MNNVSKKIPSLQISPRFMVTELQRFPFMRTRMDEVIGNFLREGLEPSENMIAHLIEMEVCTKRAHQNLVLVPKLGFSSHAQIVF